jgi:hypothetical protein
MFQGRRLMTMIRSTASAVIASAASAALAALGVTTPGQPGGQFQWEAGGYLMKSPGQEGWVPSWPHELASLSPTARRRPPRGRAGAAAAAA